jgi:CelD/BcsL family acetyltransferase involved in cellulose biosynthesis
VPLARPGREAEVAAAVTTALAGAQPRPDSLLLEGMPIHGPWLAALRDRWPGRLHARLWRTGVDGSPFVSLQEPSFDAWLDGKSSNFRGQMRRLRRRFAEAGGISRLATPATLAADAATFSRLHAARWDEKGHSNLVDLGDCFTTMLEEVGEQLLATERFALRVLELDGEPICVQLFISAGGRMLFVNGGWDERHARLKPSMLCLLDAVEDAFAHGAQQLDLGVGEQEYKLRFADGDAPLAWGVLLAPTARMPLTAARTARAAARSRLRAAALDHLSKQRLAWLRDVHGKLRGAAA